MSDTSTTTEPPRSGRSGTWNGEDDLGQIVKISDEVLARGAELTDSVNADEARALVEAILMGDAPERSFEGNADRYWAKAVATTIVRALPEEAMKASIINVLDIRPYLQVILDNPDMKLRTQEYGMSNMVSQSDGSGGRDGNRSIQSMLESQTAVARERAGIAADTAGITGASKDATIADAEAFDTTVVGLSPTTKLMDAAEVNGQAQQAGVQIAPEAGASMQDTWSPTTLAERQTAKQGFPEAYFRQLLSTGEADLSGAMQLEGQMVADGQASGYMPVDVGQEGYFGGGKPGTQKLSILDSLAYLQKLPPSQVKIMQRQMANAGYFQQIGATEGYVEGDAWDPATQGAWRQLLTDSIAQNIPVPQLVAQKAQTFRGQQRARYVDQLLDPINKDAVSMESTDAVRQLLGRGVTGDELNEITSYLDQLRLARASFITGSTDNAGDRGIQSGDRQGYDQGDINAKIMSMYGSEADQQNSFDQWQKITKAFGVEVPDEALATKD